MTNSSLRGGCSAVLSLLAIFGISTCAEADVFLDFGVMGPPGKFAVETYPVITHSGGNVSEGSDTIVAYFTKTAFTGTDRDQIELWVGATSGYSQTALGQQGQDFGISGPNVGIEYYYNLIQPKTCPNCAGYVKDTISPFVEITFPTGSSDTTGFRGNSNSYNIFTTATNYLKIERWVATIAPISVDYAARSYNVTEFALGDFRHLGGGYSFTVADFAGGYLVTPDIGIGIHHAFDFNSVAASSFQASRQGFIGPAFSYDGLGKAAGLFFRGNLNFNYYHSANLKNSPYLSLVAVKTF